MQLPRAHGKIPAGLLLLGMLCMLGMLGMGACAPSIQVVTDFDPSADFSTPKSYAWAPVQDASKVTGLLEGRLKHAVEAQLQAKGYTPAADPQRAEIYVDYHALIQNKVSVHDWGYSPAFGRDITVDQYKQGTLVIDVIDAARKQVIWRGSASGVVSETQPGSNVEKVVAGIMAEYPPKAKG